jgi:DivIVA domain-containing protein
VFTLLVIVALATVAVVALVVAGSDDRLPEHEPDREPAELPEDRLVARRDLDRVRFALGLRGYRMDQVDAVLDRTAADLDAWREHVDALEAILVERGVAVPDRPVPVIEERASRDPVDVDTVDVDTADVDRVDAEPVLGEVDPGERP